jgi:chromosome partitioning protein
MARSLKVASAPERPLAKAIPRVIAVGNGKGGTGKTSVVANVGGLAAAAGLRVLLIDLDPQGNLNRDLGYERSDGRALRDALSDSRPLPVTAGIRENLDVVQGGPGLFDLQGILFARMNRRDDAGSFADLLYSGLSAVADPYDLILIDTSPGEQLLVEGAFAVSTAVVITTRSDEASLDGVETTADRFVAAKSSNPDLQLAGAVLFAVGVQSRRLERWVRTSLEEMLGEVAPVFRTRIRHQEGAAVDARKVGKLIHELESQVAEAHKARFAALRSGKVDGTSFHASRMDGLAGEYEALTEEILARLAEIEEGAK